jgi:predicted transcriptional regulator
VKRKKTIPDLSRAEFDILRVLWNGGSLSVREVHDALKETYAWAYSTTKTMMDRMVNKRLLKREEFHRIFLYKPLITRPQGLVKWIEFIADRVLEMDYGSVVSLFGRTKALSPDEIEELTKLLENNKSLREKND